MSSSKPGDEAARALTAATRWLNTRVHSTHEARAYLTGRRVRPGIITRVLTACRQRGLLDDRACARLWADHWAGRGYAWAAIRQRLAAKGLSDAAINAAAPRGIAASDEALARQATAAWLQRHTSHHPDRLSRLLAARGFDGELIERIATEIFSAAFSDAERDVAER